MIKKYDKNNYVVGFKVTDKDMKCRDMQYEVGQDYHADRAIRCGNSGFHFCTRLIDCFSYYAFNPQNRVFVVFAWGEIDYDNSDSKASATDLHIDHEISWHEVLDLVNTGKNNTGKNNSGNDNSGNDNSGNHNSGYYNSGNHNGGDYNSGNHNSGNHNGGDYNSGNHNSGDRNTGDYNTGYRNTGHYNSGNCNGGYHNSGNYNSGNHNSGYCNSGNYNSGDYNTGDYNSCDYESGCFNSEDSYVRMFNKPTNLKYNEIYIPFIDLRLTEFVEYTKAEKDTDPNKDPIYGYLKTYSIKEAWANWDAKATNVMRNEIKALPNYDAEVFYEITGLDWRMK